MGSNDELARACAQAMWQQDRAAKAQGLELLDIGPGRARMRMPVRQDMTNGHGLCHGGYMFFLADTTFAYACNSRNQRAVAAGAEIHFLAPAFEGDVLTADGQERHLAGRSGIYDVKVTDQHDKLVALFRGRSATIKGELTPATPAGEDA